MREERRLRVFENRVLRSVFGPKRDEVTGEWRKLHNEELRIFMLTQYCAVGKIEKNEMGGACRVYGLQPATRIPLQPNHTESPTHIEPRTIRPM